MHPMWAQRREEVLRDCIVFPDVFTQIMDRLDAFVVPYLRIPRISATQSTGMLPPSPEDFCHPVHGNIATLGA